jgi:ribonuclease R
MRKKEIFFEGILAITKTGYGFVDTAKKSGVFVSQDNMNGAFSGDTVKAKIFKGKNREECEIVEIIKRGLTVLTGVYIEDKNSRLVRPYNSKIAVDFRVKREHTNGAKNGDLVVCDIISYGNKEKSPTVYIKEVLGDINKKGNDITVVLRKYGIMETFPDEVLAQQIDGNISDLELSEREDYTNETIVTIDGDDAKDLDDAVSVVKSGNDYILGVHIADVSHFVHAKTPIDMEAYYRGTSVYLPDRVAPMLPFTLSNNLCSLNPNELKLTLSCIMTINKVGEIVDYKVKKSYIKTKARLTYTNVKKMLSGVNIDELEYLRPTLEIMHELYSILRAKRKEDGFIEFNFPESKFELDENGRAIDVFPYEVSFANEIIEELMLAANVSVANFSIQNGLPFVYRVHGQPDIGKIEGLYKALKVFGINFKPNPRPTPKELDLIIKKAEDTEVQTIVHQLALRSMQKAVYSEAVSLHYGLNFPRYCHFTSPIRRYPDLIIHRIISDFLAGKPVRKYKKFVTDASIQSSETEVNAFLAERDSDDIKKAEYMSDKIGQSFTGHISGMTETGFFVSLPNTVEGFVPLSSITDDYLEYFADLFIMKGQKNSLKIGQQVEVKLVKTNIPEGKIEFLLMQNAE